MRATLSSPLPYQTQFWEGEANNATAAQQLAQVKGFITALPIDWTRDENNRIGFPTSLVAQKDGDDRSTNLPSGAEQPTVLAGAIDPQPPKQTSQT